LSRGYETTLPKTMKQCCDPDPDPAFEVNPDPDPIRIQGFDDKKIGKIQMKIFFISILIKKLQFTYPSASIKDFLKIMRIVRNLLRPSRIAQTLVCRRSAEGGEGSGRSGGISGAERPAQQPAIPAGLQHGQGSLLQEQVQLFSYKSNQCFGPGSTLMIKMNK
jgi:hypothetical protein